MRLSSQYPRTMKFFDTYVIECYSEWVSSPQSLVKASSLALHLNHLMDYYLNESNVVIEEKQKLKNKIIESCQSIEILKDYADVQKHCELTRPSNHLSSSEQAKLIQCGWGELSYGEGEYGGGEQIVLLTNEGNQLLLSPILKNCYDHWSQKLL